LNRSGARPGPNWVMSAVLTSGRALPVYRRLRTTRGYALMEAMGPEADTESVATLCLLKRSCLIARAAYRL